MNILVTGGAGFIGSNLCHHLLGEATGELAWRSRAVVTLDKLTYAGNLCQPGETWTQIHDMCLSGGISATVPWSRITSP